MIAYRSKVNYLTLLGGGLPTGGSFAKPRRYMPSLAASTANQPVQGSEPPANVEIYAPPGQGGYILPRGSWTGPAPAIAARRRGGISQVGQNGYMATNAVLTSRTAAKAMDTSSDAPVANNPNAPQGNLPVDPVTVTALKQGQTQETFADRYANELLGMSSGSSGLGSIAATAPAYNFVTSGGASGGFSPLLIIGIVAIAGAGYWWFKIRKHRSEE